MQSEPQKDIQDIEQQIPSSYKQKPKKAFHVDPESICPYLIGCRDRQSCALLHPFWCGKKKACGQYLKTGYCKNQNSGCKREHISLDEACKNFINPYQWNDQFTKRQKLFHATKEDQTTHYKNLSKKDQTISNFDKGNAKQFKKNRKREEKAQPGQEVYIKFVAENIQFRGDEGKIQFLQEDDIYEFKEEYNQIIQVGRQRIWTPSYWNEIIETGAAQVKGNDDQKGRNKEADQVSSVKKKPVGFCHFFQVTSCKNKDCKLRHEGVEASGICLVKNCAICFKETSFLPETLTFLEENTLEAINKEIRNRQEQLQSLKKVLSSIQDGHTDIIQSHRENYKEKLERLKYFIKTIHLLIQGKKLDQETKVHLAQIELKKFKQGLPAYSTRGEVMREICDKSNRFSLLIGHTGSGKSTQIPQYLLISLLQRQSKNIIYCVQPRKVAARSLSIRVAEEFGELGQLKVGYDFGGHDRSDSVKNKTSQLIFTTEKRILKKLIMWKNTLKSNSKFLLHFIECILLDEVHERSFYMDIITGCLKSLHQEKKLLPENLKIILCSATIDQKLFTEFFYNCNVLKIEGTTHPIIDCFKPPNNPEQQLDHIVEIVREILYEKQAGLTKPIYGHILIFLDSVPNICRMQSSLEKLIAQMKEVEESDYCILPLHGMIEPQEQMKVFEEQFNDQTERYMTKIVLSTKIAESSVTINGVTVVIDTGLAKEASYDPVRKITTIDTELISKAQAVQRRGRAGRTSEGICYRAYSEDDYNSMEAGKLPEIKKTNSDMILLKILGLGANIEEFDLIDKIDPVVVSQGIKSLMHMGAIENNQLTEKGKLMSEFPTEPGMTNVILQAFKRDCVDSVIKIIAMMSNANNIFKRVKSDQKIIWSDFVKTLKQSQSDFIMFEGLLTEFLKQKFKERKLFCQENQLSFKSLNLSQIEYEELRKELYGKEKYIDDSLKAFFVKDETLSKENHALKLTKCFFSTYFSNYSQPQSLQRILQCGDIRYKADYNSAIQIYLNQKSQDSLCFFLKMSSMGERQYGYVLSPLTPEVYNDSTVVNKQVLAETIAEKQALFDEFDPLNIPISNCDQPQFFKKYGKDLKQLMHQYAFNWEFMDSQLVVHAKKKINKLLDDPTAERTWIELQRTIQSFQIQFLERQQKKMLEAAMDHSDIRFIFDPYLRIQEVLAPKEFVKMKIEGLPKASVGDYFKLLQIDESQLSNSSCFLDQNGDPVLDLHFLQKNEASKNYARIHKSKLYGQDIICKPQSKQFDQNSKKSIFVKISWVLFESHGSAHIYFENDLDPPKVITMLQNRMLQGKSLRPLIDKKNNKAVYMKGLDLKTDEQDISALLDPGEFFGIPKIAVHRNNEKDSQALVERYNESFSTFLLDNGLSQYLSKTLFDCNSIHVSASFKVDTHEEGQALFQRYDGKVGIIGHQKTRVSVQNQTVTTVNKDIFEIMKPRYQCLVDQMIVQNTKHRLSIYVKVPKFGKIQKVSVIVASQNHVLNAHVTNRLHLLFFEGETLFEINLIIKWKKDIFEKLQEEYKDVAVFKKNKQNWKLFTTSDEITRKIKQDLEKTNQAIIESIQKRKKAKGGSGNNDDDKLCIICFCPDQLDQLQCGHYFHKECLEGYVQITCKNKLLCGIKCPSGQDCKLISMDILKQSLQGEFEPLLQKAMIEFTSSKDNSSIKGCWTPDCPAWFLLQGQKEHECQTCCKTWCLKKPDRIFSTSKDDKLKEHESHSDDLDCAAYAGSKFNDDEFEKLILPQGTIISSNELALKKQKGELVFRRCPNPNCGTPIEHKDACKKMHCNQCHALFCFTCGKQFRDEQKVYAHMQEEHGNIY